MIWFSDRITRVALRKIIYLGLSDAFRALNPESGRHSWWGYHAGGWPKDHGMRIDHLPQHRD